MGCGDVGIPQGLTMLGLVDGNNFYVSCERIFDPTLRGKPTIVLSNNDGCAIARSNEAKQLGIKMGQPLHEIPSNLRRNLHVRSANFALYGDISNRVATVLKDLFAQVEMYSIDESFIALDGIKEADWIPTCVEARQRILKWVGIPTCVGIGPTKTLAKLANKSAKTTPLGVLRATRGLVRRFPVEDVWGVGRKYAQRLKSEGVTTAQHLSEMDPTSLQSRYGVVLARTQKELRGVPCAELEVEEPQRQQIIVSRSFGKEITDLSDLMQATSTFAQRACEKLRRRNLQAGGVWVFFHTNPFKDVPQYHPHKSLSFVIPTSDTRDILCMVEGLTKAMYRDAYAWKKAGVGLVDLTSKTIVQGDLFAQASPRSTALMNVLDQCNEKFGRGAMSFASSAVAHDTKAKWEMRQSNLSQAFTTRWGELLNVRL